MASERGDSGCCASEILEQDTEHAAGKVRGVVHMFLCNCKEGQKSEAENPDWVSYKLCATRWLFCWVVDNVTEQGWTGASS